MLHRNVSSQSSAFVQKTSVFVLPLTGTVTVYLKTLAIVSQRYSLMEPFSADVMLRFTTITPFGFKRACTSLKNSTLESWNGMVIS